jgi:hypothetical protein
VDSELVIGVISAGAALGGALLGAGAAILSARHQAKAARYQADAQRKAQHEQWLREQLNDQYLELLEIVDSCLPPILQAQLHLLDGRREEAREALLTVDASALQPHHKELRVKAPRSVTEPLYEIAGAFSTARRLGPDCMDPDEDPTTLVTELTLVTSALAENRTKLVEAIRRIMRPEDDS